MILKQFTLFDKIHFGIVKGVGIFVIVLVHLCNRYLGFPYLSPIAGAAVAIFLLCSGYGLSESFQKKNLKGYWMDKWIKIWVPSALSLCLVGWIKSIDFADLCAEYPLLLYGWYLQVLFFDYLIFWCIYRFAPQKIRVVLLFAFSIIVFIFTPNQLYAEQLLCFPIGVAASAWKLKEKLERQSGKRLFTGLILMVILILGTFLCRKVFEYYIFFNFVWLVFKASSAIFVILAIYALRRVPLVRVFIPLGKISYALYLLNNHTLSVLNAVKINATSVTGVVLFTIASAYMFTKVCDLINRIYLQLKSRRESVV